MNVKVVNRYVELLTDIIDTKIRVEGQNSTFNKEYIMSVLSRNEDEESQITEKIYKQTVKWFKERFIFDTEGETFGLKYKLHKDFQYKLSQKRETIIKQCRFIIGQMVLFSDVLWDKSESLYVDVITADVFFQLLSTLPSQTIKDTISTVLIHKNNRDFNGIYPYETLQTLIQTQTPFTITIENKTISAIMKNATIKNIEFNSDTVSVVFNNSHFELDSLSDIKKIDVFIPTDIFENIDETMEYLQSTDIELVVSLMELLREYKNAKDIFFTNLFEEMK